MNGRLEGCMLNTGEWVPVLEGGMGSGMGDVGDKTKQNNE